MIDKQKQFERQNSFIKEKYDRINLVVPKGEKERLQEIAQEKCVSLNALIIQAIEQYIKK